jgi:hypothetical protein
LCRARLASGMRALKASSFFISFNAPCRRRRAA